MKPPAASRTSDGLFPSSARTAWNDPLEYSAPADIVPGQHLIIARDVSDRIEREQDLAKASGRIEAIIAASPDPIIAVERDGIVRVWNTAAEDVIKYRQEEVLGKSIQTLELSGGQNQSRYETLFERAMEGKPLSNLVVELATKDGDTKHVSISSAPILDEFGTVTSVMAICRTVTERVEQ